MVLAQQVHPDSLKRSAGGALLAEVSAVLEGQQDGSQQSLPAVGPTVLRTSAAVSAIFACIDWARLRRGTAGEASWRAGGAAGRQPAGQGSC